MRRITVLALFATMCLFGTALVAQKKPGPLRENPRMQAQDSPQQMKQLVHRVFEDLFNNGRYGAVSEIYASNCVVHERGKTVPLEHSVSEGKNFRAAAPDVHMTPGSMSVEGNIVTVSWTGRGSQSGRASGFAKPTGKHFQVSGTSRFRIENGRIAEVWNDWDRNELFRQIGVSPTAAYLYDKAEDVMLALERIFPRGPS